MTSSPLDGGPTPPDPPAGAGLPLVMDLTGRPCLVVGGGPVAARKVLTLVAAGARVTVVAKEVAPSPDGAEPLDALATVERGPYRSGQAAHFDLVVAATGDPAVDSAVVADARAAGVLVNSADERRPGDVRLPAVLRRGPVTVAVSTGGASPAIAAWLRDRIAATLPPGLDVLVALVEEARGRWQASGRPTGAVGWAALLDDEVLPLVEAGRIDDARDALRDALGTGRPGTGPGPGPAPRYPGATPR